MAPAPSVPFDVLAEEGTTHFPLIGAIDTFGSQAPVTTGNDGIAHIVAADDSPQNNVLRFAGKTVTVPAYDPTLGNTTVPVTYTTYLVFYADAGAVGGISDSLGNPPVTPFAGKGAGNCPIRSEGVFTVDNAGIILIKSDQDHLWYSIAVDTVTGNITVTGTPPPDGTTIMIPTT